MLILRSNAVWVRLTPIGVGRCSLEEMRHYVHATKATSPLSMHSPAQTRPGWIPTDFSIVEPIRCSTDPNTYLSLQMQRFSTSFCSSLDSKRLQAPAEPEIDRYSKLVAENCNGPGLESSLL
jgi:hypothetical protein